MADTEHSPRRWRRRATGMAAAAAVVTMLALCYGAFAVAAMHSVRGGSGALEADDFYTTGANPWAWPPAAATQPPPERMPFAPPPVAMP